MQLPPQNGQNLPFFDGKWPFFYVFYRFSKIYTSSYLLLFFILFVLRKKDSLMYFEHPGRSRPSLALNGKMLASFIDGWFGWRDYANLSSRPNQMEAADTQRTFSQTSERIACCQKVWVKNVCFWPFFEVAWGSMTSNLST